MVFAMRRGVAVPVTSVLLCSSLALGLASCTPRPDVADSAAESFLSALSDPGTASTAADQTDNPSAAGEVIGRTWSSLQAEGLHAELKEVKTSGDAATARYHMTWDLPGDREFEYDSTMTLSRSNERWAVRWQSAVLHPDLGANQHLELRSVPAPQASVVGSDGAVLLEPGRQYRVFVETSAVDDLGRTMRRIGAELDGLRGGDKSQVPAFDADAATREAGEVDGEYSALIVNADIGRKLGDRLANVDGVRLNEEPALVRPDPSLAPDILSRVSSLVKEDLEGSNGWKVVTATPEGSEVRQLTTHEATVASAVRVSLSRKVQEAAQVAVDSRGDSKAMMVVIRPSTGEILAVAQSKAADKEGPLALTGQYPPGSTFKILTAFAGLRDQNLTPDSTIGCPGTQDIGGRIVTNYNGFSLGNTALENAFARSCNTTFADISTKLAPGELKEVSKEFGLGVDFDIEGLETITGSVPEGEVMLDRTEAGYGQGHDLASPFGMALVAATAAAGHLPTPFLIAGKDHGTEASGEADGALSPDDIAGLQRMMRTVVTSGTATAISDAGEVYGKTGEAEVNQGSHSWFAGYRGDLAFATLVVLGGGSENAVEATSQFFRHLDKKDGADGTGSGADAR